MKAAVLYHSVTDTTKEMAEVIVQGMQKLTDMQAKAFSIDDVDEQWLKESKCIILGSPIYMASVSEQVKIYLEKSFRKCEPAGKLGGAFATADYIHGGGDLGINLILNHMMVFGMIVYSGGGSCGKPVIHLGPVAIKNYTDEVKETFMLYGERMAKKTMDLFAK